MSDSIDRLREIAERCLSGQPLDEDMSHWLGDSLEKYLSQCAKTIDDAFGLNFPKGGIPWWLEEANRMRDMALQELADLFFPDCSITKNAREIATMAERYAPRAGDSNATGRKCREVMRARSANICGWPSSPVPPCPLASASCATSLLPELERFKIDRNHLTGIILPRGQECFAQA